MLNYRIIKRVISLILIIIIIYLPACNKEFTFRGHKFNETTEEIQKTEGNNYQTKQSDNIKYIYYDDVQYANSTGQATFVLIENKLKYIYFIVHEEKKKEDIIDKIKGGMNIGDPEKEVEINDGYKAMWGKDDYGIVLIAANSEALIIFGPYSKMTKFYETMHVTDLD